MAKQKIKKQVEEMLKSFLKEEGYDLYHMDYLKEGKDYFLRIFIDQLPGGEKHYIGTEDCEKVSRYISEKLDEEDSIEEQYYLEVSSPGLDRELKNLNHYQRYIGSQVEVHLYAPLYGEKVLVGTLITANEKQIEIEKEEKIIEIGSDKIAKTKLAILDF